MKIAHLFYTSSHFGIYNLIFISKNVMIKKQYNIKYAILTMIIM